MKSYQGILKSAEVIFGNLTHIQREFIQSIRLGKPFIEINNMTVEGLMDQLLIPDNTNISFELGYNTKVSSKSRFIRSTIDFSSNSETAKKIQFLVLEDLCYVYNLSPRLAASMNVIIDEMESSVRAFSLSQNIS